MNKLSFGDIEVSKKEFYESKKAVSLDVVDINDYEIDLDSDYESD